MPLWDQVKSNIVEWYESAADKTEELAKIGVRRYDKFGISRDIERQFTELGSLVYNGMREGRSDWAGDATVNAIVERIGRLEEELRRKEEEIESIRDEHRRRTAEKAGRRTDRQTTQAEGPEAAAPGGEPAVDEGPAADDGSETPGNPAQ
jgi:hypothetical protein